MIEKPKNDLFRFLFTPDILKSLDFQTGCIVSNKMHCIDNTAKYLVISNKLVLWIYYATEGERALSGVLQT